MHLSCNNYYTHYADNREHLKLLFANIKGANAQSDQRLFCSFPAQLSGGTGEILALGPNLRP